MISVQVKLMRDLVLAHLVGDIAKGESGLGVSNGHVVDGASECAAGITIGECCCCRRLSGRVLQLGADAEGAASARATIPAPAANTSARVQMQDAKRAILIYFSSMVGLILAEEIGDCVVTLSISRSCLLLSAARTGRLRA